MVFSDIAQKAFSSIQKDKNDNLWSILPDGLTLEMVLDNQAPSPFSLKDFTEYLKNTYCHENLLFFQAVMEYKEQCMTYFGLNDEQECSSVVLLDGISIFDFSALNKSLLSTKEEVWFELLVEKFDFILKDFILSDAPHEINIPYEVRHQLLQSHQSHLLYHPTLLYPACSAVVELMRISAFIPFATDSNRHHYYPIRKKSSSFNIKKQKSSPTFINTTCYLNHLPPSPPLLTPPIQTTIAPVDDSLGFFKKITSPFRLRSSSPNDTTSRSSWRQINIPDLSPFKSISTTLVPSAYSNTASNHPTTSTSYSFSSK